MISCKNQEEILREQVKVLNSTVSNLQKEREIQKELPLSIISGGEKKCSNDSNKSSQGNIQKRNLKDQVLSN